MTTTYWKVSAESAAQSVQVSMDIMSRVGGITQIEQAPPQRRSRSDGVEVVYITASWRSSDGLSCNPASAVKTALKGHNKNGTAMAGACLHLLNSSATASSCHMPGSPASPVCVSGGLSAPSQGPAAQTAAPHMMPHCQHHRLRRGCAWQSCTCGTCTSR